MASTTPHHQIRGSRLPGIAVAAGLHAAIVAALLTHAPLREQLAEMAPLMVSLVQPAKEPQPTELPRPKPVAKQPVRQPDPRPEPLLTAPAASTEPPAIAPPPPAPPRPAEPIVAAPQAPVIPPQFNADYLNNPAPLYPALSKRLGEEGRVMLRVFVDEDGLPARVEMRSSSGHERLDNVALETVRRWKFVPARRGDRAVSAWVLVPISFSLRS